MPWNELITVFAATAGIALGAVLLLWLLSIPLRDVSIIDMAFAAIIAALVIAARQVAGGAGPANDLTVALVAIWALRMTLHLVRRNWGHGEDPRYTRLRGWVPEGWPFHRLSLRQVFLLQGAVIWLLTLPQQIAMVTGAGAAIGPWAVAGLVLWLVGFFFESVGDWQLARFRADPANRGRVLDTGLWRYTRHPNYFGELTQWWGLFLIALESPWAWLGIVGPLIYSHLVINVTGQATLDKKLSREKPGYADYVHRTSGLIPLPPRRD